MTKAKKPSKPSRQSSHYTWSERWFLHQCRSAVQSIGYMWRTPVTTLMIILVIGMTLAMPLGLSTTLKTIQNLSPNWQQQTPISVYLKVGTSTQQAHQLQSKLATSPIIQDARYITPEQGLQEMRHQAGYGDVLDALESNPLPGVIVLTPQANQHEHDLSQTVKELSQQSIVDTVKLDIDWVKRLHALLGLGHQVVLLLAVSMGMGVLLVVGNIIALGLQKYKQDMIVYQYLGASDYFIRQPFLYMGAWIGALGGASAWGLVKLAAIQLQPAMHQLTAQYGISLDNHTLAYIQAARVTALGALLGILGARLAVGRFLRAIQLR